MINLQTIKKIALVLGCGLIFSIAAFAQTTAFTYQGRFTDSTAPQPTNGSYEMQFKLYTTAVINTGTQIGETQVVPTVQVVNGVFTVQLDAENSFRSGADLFVEISVRPAGSAAALTKLAPRQQITSAPYAIQSKNAMTATLADDSNKLGGVAASGYVQTVDSRLSDARTPLAGSADYIQNTTSAQASANFNISGTGTAGNLTAGGTILGNVVNSATTYKIAGATVFSTPNDTSVVAGQLANHTASAGNNTFFGYRAGTANSADANNTVVGAQTGSTNILGAGNALFGFNAKGAGNNNLVAGTEANALGSKNTLLGYQAGADGNNNTVVGSQASAAGGIVNSTAIGNQAFVNTSYTIVLGTNLETTKIPGAFYVAGKAKIDTLGAPGSTSLCRNAANEISTCTAGYSPEKDRSQIAAINQQNLEMKEQLERQQKQIAEQSEKNKQLQTQIDDLRKIFCGLNPSATVCAQ